MKNWIWQASLHSCIYAPKNKSRVPGNRKLNRFKVITTVIKSRKKEVLNKMRSTYAFYWELLYKIRIRSYSFRLLNNFSNKNYWVTSALFTWLCRYYWSWISWYREGWNCYSQGISSLKLLLSRNNSICIFLTIYVFLYYLCIFLLCVPSTVSLNIILFIHSSLCKLEGFFNV